MFPLESATRPCGPESSIFSAYSWNAPVLGSTRPSLFCNCSVNHSAPSAPTAGSCGCAPFVGSSHSRIVTLSSPTSAPGAAPRDANAIPSPKPRIATPKIVVLLLLISTSRPKSVLAVGRVISLSWAPENGTSLSLAPCGPPLPFANLITRAGVVQWQYRSFPSFGRGFDSHRPLHKRTNGTRSKIMVKLNCAVLAITSSWSKGHLPSSTGNPLGNQPNIGTPLNSAHCALK